MSFEYTTGVIPDLSIQDLQQRRANTWETYNNCLGHSKSHYNHLILGQYDTVLLLVLFLTFANTMQSLHRVALLQTKPSKAFSTALVLTNLSRC